MEGDGQGESGREGESEDGRDEERRRKGETGKGGGGVPFEGKSAEA